MGVPRAYDAESLVLRRAPRTAPTTAVCPFLHQKPTERPTFRSSPQPTRRPWQHGALHLKSLVSLLRPGVLLFAKNDSGMEAVAR